VACVASADNSSSGTETATWTNATSATQTVYALFGHWHSKALTFTPTFTLQ